MAKINHQPPQEKHQITRNDLYTVFLSAVQIYLFYVNLAAIKSNFINLLYNKSTLTIIISTVYSGLLFMIFMNLFNLWSSYKTLDLAEQRSKISQTFIITLLVLLASAVAEFLIIRMIHLPVQN
jgi:hypothetical protein